MAINLGELNDRNKKQQQELYNQHYNNVGGLNLRRKSSLEEERRRREEEERLRKQQEEQNSFFKSGDSNFGIGMAASSGDFLLDVGQGFFRTLEGVADFLQYSASDSQKMGSKALESIFGKNAVSDFYSGMSDFFKENAKFDSTGSLFGTNENAQDTLFGNEWRQNIDQSSYLGGMGDQIGEGIGNIGAMAAMSAVGGSALGATGIGVTEAGTLTTGGKLLLSGGNSYISAYGNARSEAYKNGASDDEANKYAIINGLAEAVSEQFFDSMPGISSAGFAEKIGIKDFLANKIKSGVGSNTAKVFLKLVGGFEEGAEEMISNALVAVGQDIMHSLDENYTYGMDNLTGNIVEDFKNNFVSEDSLKSFISAGFTSVLLGAGGDILTTAQTNQVINAFAKDNNMSFKEAKALLGGENLNQAQQQVQREDNGNISNQVELEDAAKQRIINYMKANKGKGIESRIEALVQNEAQKKGIEYTPQQLKEEADKIRAELIDQTNSPDRYMNFAQTDKETNNELAESFRKAGVNNSQQAHEMYNFVSKLQESNKNLKYQVVNNKILKEMGQSVEGATINGFNQDGTIYINMDAKNPYQAVAYHEIAHSIKDTSPELYNELKNLVFELKGKEGLENYRKLYRVDNNELASDLTENVEDEYINDQLGEILNDDNFINKIDNRNIIQKLIDEIKRVVKYMTSSKDQKALMKTQQRLEEIYKQGLSEAESKEGTAFSLDEDLEKYVYPGQVYENFQNEDKSKITQSVEELEEYKKTLDTDTDEGWTNNFNANAKIRALEAGYDNLYDYYVGQEKARLKGDAERGVGLATRLIEEGRQNDQKNNQLQEDISKATPKQNEQFEIIQRTNPAPNDQLVWIRSPLDIKTFEQVVNDEDGFSWGDYSLEDAKRDLKRNKVRVYSSYAIHNGTFVSTSYQQALDYAGGDSSQVHSREVNPNNIAWISGDEGQYASPKARFSLSVEEANTGIDNDGATLSEGQKEYFKNSKATDEEGNLIRVYHTTTDSVVQFNEFNPVGTGGYKFGDQVVNYFTDSKEMSGSYADSYYEMADTKRLESVNDAKSWLQSINTYLDTNMYIEGLNVIDEYDGEVLSYQNEDELMRNIKSDIQRKFGNESRLQYQGYVNLVNPYVIDAEGRYWNKVESKGDTEKTTRLLNVPAEIKQELIDMANESIHSFDETYFNWKQADNAVNYVARDRNNVTLEQRTLHRMIHQLEYNDVREILDGKGSWGKKISFMDFLHHEDFITEQEWQEFEKTDKIPQEILERIDKKLNAPLRYEDRYLANEMEALGLPLEVKETTLNDLWRTREEAYKAYDENGRDESSQFVKKMMQPDNELKYSRYGKIDDLFYTAKNDFTDNYIREQYNDWAVTNDIVQKIIDLNKYGENYDGVIMKNVIDYGGKSENEEYIPHDLYITFASNQFKGLDNFNPTEDADIRYSLSQSEELNDYIEKNNYTFKDNGNLEVSNLTDKQINELVKIYHTTGYDDVDANYLKEMLKRDKPILMREVADRFIEKELGHKPQIDTTKVFEDSEGNSLTQEQVNFFKDSGVRDIRGRLIPVYHRTDADFTIFDSKAGKQHGNKYGKGFYFSITPENYGNNTMKVYLNAKDGEYKYIPKAGYYIVQEPNMIKNVDNLKPTENEDIRYQLAEEQREPANNLLKVIESYDDYLNTLPSYQRLQKRQEGTPLSNYTDESHGILTKEDYKNKKIELFDKQIEKADNKMEEQAKRFARENLELTRKAREQLQTIIDKYKGQSRESIFNSNAKEEIREFVRNNSRQEFVEEIIDEQTRDLQRAIRNTELVISKDSAGEFADGITAFKKNNPGLKIKYGKQNIDSVYQELQEQFPGMLETDVSDKDIPFILADVLKKSYRQFDNSNVQVFELNDNEIENIANKIYKGLTNNAITDEQLESLTKEISKKVEEKYARAMATEKYREIARNTIDVTDIKDKKRGIQYKINTMKRNLRDIMSKEQAQLWYDTYFKPITIHNAQSEIDKQDYVERIQKYNLNNAESTYTQMLGELKYNPETNLTSDQVNTYAETHNVDKQKCTEAVEEFRNIYDELIGRVNEALKANGYKEIDYRKGYFPHFIEDKPNSIIGKFADKFGWNIQKGTLPTDIAGLTDGFKPGKAWTSFSQQRTGDNTDYNALKGMDNYLRGAMDLIYHTEDIQKLRALENEIRYQYSSDGVKTQIDEIYANQELSAEEKAQQIALLTDNLRDNPLGNLVTELRDYTNGLANKKSILDRGMEQALGRDWYSIMNNINGRVSANMVGANLSSAMTNFIPITQAWSQVSTKNLMRGMYESIKNTLKNDGFDQNSVYLTNRTQQADTLYQTTLDKVNQKLGLLFEGIDSFTSNTIVRAKYYENLDKGMSEQSAIENADEFAKDVMAGRSKGDQPTIFNTKNPLYKMFTAFQLEVNNQYGYMFKDIPADLGDEGKDKLAMAFMKMFIGAWLYNMITEKITGRKAAFSPIDMAVDEYKIATSDMDLPTKVQNIAKDVAQETPFLGGIMGGGRLPLQSAIPFENPLDMVTKTFENIGTALGDDEDKKKTAINSLKKEWMKPVYYIALPFAGGQIKKSAEGMAMYNESLPVAGSYTDAGKLRFEADTSPQGRLQALLFGQYASANAREYFDKGYTPLSEKQINEALNANLPMAEYREINQGISNARALAKANKENQTAAMYDYINSLPLSDEQKNSLINSKQGNSNEVKDDNGYIKYTDGSKTYWYDAENDIVYNSKYKEVKKDINELTKYSNMKDVSDYDNYGSYEEFTYATNNPSKYNTIKQITDYEQYNIYKDEIAAIKENYKTAAGRKKAVAKYINGLSLNQYQKVMLYKMAGGYSIKEYSNQIEEYINGLDATAYDKYSIYDELFGTDYASKYIESTNLPPAPPTNLPTSQPVQQTNLPTASPAAPYYEPESVDEYRGLDGKTYYRDDTNNLLYDEFMNPVVDDRKYNDEFNEGLRSVKYKGNKKDLVKYYDGNNNVVWVDEETDEAYDTDYNLLPDEYYNEVQNIPNTQSFGLTRSKFNGDKSELRKFKDATGKVFYEDEETERIYDSNLNLIVNNNKLPILKPKKL